MPRWAGRPVRDQVVERAAWTFAGLSLLGAVVIHPWGFLAAFLPSLYSSQVAQLFFWALALLAGFLGLLFFLVRGRPIAFGNTVLCLATLVACFVVAEVVLRQVDFAANELQLYREWGTGTRSP